MKEADGNNGKNNESKTTVHTFPCSLMAAELQTDTPVMSSRCSAGATRLQSHVATKKRETPVLPSVNSVQVSSNALSLFTRYLTACQASSFMPPSFGKGKLQENLCAASAVGIAKPKSHCLAVHEVAGRVQGPDLVELTGLYV